MLKIPPRMRQGSWEYKALSQFEPILTRHMIQRFGQRYCPETFKPWYIVIQNTNVKFNKPWHWIPPSILPKLIKDIKLSLFSTTYYIEWKWLITEWEYGFYIISPFCEIITFYREMEKDYKKAAKNVDFTFRANYIMQSPYLEAQKRELLDRTCSFKTFRNRKTPL